jgi:hypothetical protein
MEVSRAQQPRLLLLGRAGGCRGRFSGPEDPCSRGPMDTASPASVGEYIVAYSAFYE